jgi:ABC-type uncharacterized transport system substrate-binding protein
VNTRALQLAIAALLCSGVSAHAHPHVWVTTETTVLYENGAFVGLRHKWSFDELYSVSAVEELSKSKDGKYGRDELAEMAKADIEGLKETGYFTDPRLAGQRVQMGEARDYWLEYRDGILALYFTIPFERPVPTDAKGLTFTVSDPEFFIAFEFAKVDPVRFSDAAPASCKASIESHEADKSVADALQKQFGAFAVTTSMVAAVTCDRP